MRRKVYLAVLSALCVILLLVSCTNPVKKDISINISLTGEAANINYSKFSTTPASFEDNIVVNKYKVYLYQAGTEVYQQEATNISNNTISLHLTNINSGTYTLRVEAFKDTTPIFYGEKVVQLSYGQNNTQLTTYFNKARLTVNVENQAEGFELTGLSIKGTLPATPTNNFVENAPFQNKEIYPGVWHIDLEATMTSDSSSVKVTYPTKAYEIYPSEDKMLGLVVKRDDLGNVYIDLQPLRVRIVNPTNGETLHGTVTILAEVQANEGIAQVEFFANDKLLKGFISSPYEYAW
ncbi:MAG TPA: Ig-like domain-containing protein, partial [Fervidobacterium sp.]|nr:Ig-like domain-containing protein [Fervidobacterium sp.]